MTSVEFIMPNCMFLIAESPGNTQCRGAHDRTARYSAKEQASYFNGYVFDQRIFILKEVSWKGTVNPVPWFQDSQSVQLPLLVNVIQASIVILSFLNGWVM